MLHYTPDQTALLLNFLYYDANSDGWKCREEIRKTNRKYYTSSFNYVICYSGSWSNLWKALKPLLADGLVEERDHAYLDKKKRPATRKEWRMSTTSFEALKTILSLAYSYERERPDTKLTQFVESSDYFNLEVEDKGKVVIEDILPTGLTLVMSVILSHQAPKLYAKTAATLDFLRKYMKSKNIKLPSKKEIKKISDSNIFQSSIVDLLYKSETQNFEGFENEG